MNDIIAHFIRILTGIGRLPDDNLPTSTAIFYSNHSSHLDFLSIWAALPKQIRLKTRPVAGRDYWEKDPIRQYLANKVFNALLIERKNVSRKSNPLEPMLNALDIKNNLIVFPEGTRSLDGQVGDFKSGIFHIARGRPTVPLIPIYLQNMCRILPKGGFLPLPIIGGIKIGLPLFLQEGEKREAFLLRAKKELIKLDT
jgi:1-acyl-sn-glycerol-3-phosphate acyltransferase